jgi:ArsR family transcriptional regulator, arsenate/arsenite/antimonite-responsive transcriptional repressor / arsenate reductase (thioredoxin)
MNAELTSGVEARAAVHAALADPARLQIVDTLGAGDASPSELAAMLAMPSNLLAHHLDVIQRAGLITRRRSDGDRRRTYLQLVPGALETLTAPAARTAARVWRRASGLPAASAGTHPAARIEPGAIAAARRHRLPMRHLRPRRIGDVRRDGDLVITVCDLAREELGHQAAVHWSVPDPVPAGDPASFDAALAELSHRVERLVPRLAATA